MEQLHEKCAVTGVSTLEHGSDAAHIAYQSLFSLQHRGVEGSGIVTNGNGDSMIDVRRPGMVIDVFSPDDIRKLVGTTAVGHNRYSTNGGRNAHLQPVMNQHIHFALAHNGNIPDTTELERYLGDRNYKTAQYNDSELLSHTIASLLHNGHTPETAAERLAEVATGSYSCTMMFDGELYAFRDPHGIRPLELGTFDGGMLVASESCAFETVGAMHLDEVAPGQMVRIQDGRVESRFQFAEPNPKLDIFELVYFARHDSTINGMRVNEVRREFGKRLARRNPLWQDDISRSVVMPVPDTSIPAAEGFAEETGLRSEQAIIKNRYVGRTFMLPSQHLRQHTLRQKHTIISERAKGRDVYLIDDSIVRLNTMPRLVEMARAAGARSVSVLVASPPVRFPDFYGVDTPHQSELAAANLTIEQMRDKMGADYLGFLHLSDMIDATGMLYEQFNLAAFNGEYPIDIGDRAKQVLSPVSTEYLE